MTKKEHSMLWQYYHSNDVTLDDCYGHWSRDKQIAYNKCEEDRLSMNGRSERIPSHNCNFFSYAYLFDIVGVNGEPETWLRYFTYANCYTFRIDYRHVAYDDLWMYL